MLRYYHSFLYFEFLQVFILLTYSIIALYLLLPSDLQKEDGNKHEEEPLKDSKVTRDEAKSSSESAMFLNIWEVMYLLSIILIEFYASFLHWKILGDKLPFLPLMLISVYCAGGIVWSWSQPDIVEVVVLKQEWV